MTPLEASACKMPTEAEEDWMMAVKIAPARMPRIGLENLVISETKASDSRRGTIELLIMSIPMNRIPKPAMILPKWWIFSFFTKTIIATPRKANSGATAPISSAINWPVMVVPTLAPMIIHTACCKVIMPEFTKPTTMTVVADED